MCAHWFCFWNVFKCNLLKPAESLSIGIVEDLLTGNLNKDGIKDIVFGCRYGGTYVPTIFAIITY